MAGTYFDYQPGRIEARFSHEAESDFINLNVRLLGDITTTTVCIDQGKLADSVIHQSDPVEFSVYFSSVFCPFKDFIRFLEAITIEVQDCGFEWDRDGPFGRMQWQRRFVNDTGFLTIEWRSSTQNFCHRTMLNTREAVKILYESFRAFADSEDYDPMRYEELSNGEGFQFVLADATLDGLVRTLTPLDAQSVHSAITRLRETAGARSMKGPKVSFPLGYYLEQDWSELSLTEWDQWIPEDWDALNHALRKDALHELLGWGASAGAVPICANCGPRSPKRGWPNQILHPGVPTGSQ